MQGKNLPTLTPHVDHYTSRVTYQFVSKHHYTRLTVAFSTSLQVAISVCGGDSNFSNCLTNWSPNPLFAPVINMFFAFIFFGSLLRQVSLASSASYKGQGFTRMCVE